MGAHMGPIWVPYRLLAGRLLGSILFDIEPKVKGQIMYFLVNVSPPKRLDVATSNFVAE